MVRKRSQDQLYLGLGQTEKDELGLDPFFTYMIKPQLLLPNSPRFTRTTDAGFDGHTQARPSAHTRGQVLGVTEL